jgi:hypothetical protein
VVGTSVGVEVGSWVAVGTGVAVNIGVAVGAGATGTQDININIVRLVINKKRFMIRLSKKQPCEGFMVS